MEHTLKPNNCCERLFLAELVENEPGVLLLECCTCGRVWRRERDGRLLPLAGDEPPGMVETGT